MHAFLTTQFLENVMTFLLDVVAGLLFIASSPPTAMCRGTGPEPDPSNAATSVAYMAKLVTASDSRSDLARQRYGLPLLPSAAVSLVTDEAICEQAAQAYAAHALAEPIAPVPVYVVRVGETRYYVWSPDVKGGEFVSHVILTNAFVYVAGFGA